MSLTRAVCPGSFDPVTHGHLDVLRRACALFDEVVVAVLREPRQVSALRDEERMALLRETCADLPGIEVVGFSGLLTRFCAERGIGVVVKGVRGGADFDYEMPMAQMNAALTGLDTVYLPTSPAFSFRLLEPGQGGRRPRRGRLRPGPGAGARRARAQAGDRGGLSRRVRRGLAGPGTASTLNRSPPAAPRK